MVGSTADGRPDAPSRTKQQRAGVMDGISTNVVPLPIKQTGSTPPTRHREWPLLDEVRSFRERALDNGYLQPSGWMIELIHEYEYDDLDGRDSRILTFARGNMPVLCSTFYAATRLAEACFPNPTIISTGVRFSNNSR